jgi:hypothetical protein
VIDPSEFCLHLLSTGTFLGGALAADCGLFDWVPNKLSVGFACTGLAAAFVLLTLRVPPRVGTTISFFGTGLATPKRLRVPVFIGAFVTGFGVAPNILMLPLWFGTFISFFGDIFASFGGEEEKNENVDFFASTTGT